MNHITMSATRYLSWTLSHPSTKPLPWQINKKPIHKKPIHMFPRPKLLPSQERSQQGASRGRGRNGPRKPMLCTYYKKTNHATENCYFKHGFPPSQKTRNQRNTLQLSTETSTATKNVQHQNSNSADSSLHLSQDDYCNIHKIFNEIKK